MNPILPINYFVPDGEAREMPDGRLYLYGSYDISGSDTYCSDVLHVFSTDNLEEWKDHGVVFSCKDVPWAEPGMYLYAPDCVYKEGKYYLFFCLSDGSEGVAVSEKPWGPFMNPARLHFSSEEGIDPAVLVDDDGEVYYFWGQFQLRGAKLNADMSSVFTGTEQEYILDEKRHGFHEGASIRKRGNKYYLIYTDISRGCATSFGYAVSEKPLGPYVKKGIIIDNSGCDPQSWNNHGCIASFKGKWYVFYHRSSQNSKFNRRMCIEPIEFDEFGDIKEVSMTSQGCSRALKPGTGINASRICRIGNGAFLYPENSEEEYLTGIKNGSWSLFKYVEFNGETVCEIECASVRGGTVEIWTEEEMIGCCKIDSTGSWTRWENFTCEIKSVFGNRELYFVFRGGMNGGNLMNMKNFWLRM